MNSKIESLARAKGYENVQQFALGSGLSWPAAKSIWQGDIQNKTLKTLVRASRALECKLEDLYE